MDNQRLILFIALSFVVLLMWQAWMEDYGQAPTAVESASTPGTPADAEQELPELRPLDATDTPAASPLEDGGLLKPGQPVRVVTDVLDLEISTRGGDVRKLLLPTYPVSTEPDAEPMPLMNDSLPNLFVAQSGLRSTDGPEPTHHVEYRAEQDHYELAPGSDELRVPLHWTSPEGVRVTKTYILTRGKFDIRVEHRVENGSAQPWSGREYRQLQRTQVAEAGQSAFIYTYMGGVIYSPEEKYEKITFSDMMNQSLQRQISGGWAAMIQHYFLGAWVPASDMPADYYSMVLGNTRYVLGMVDLQPRTAQPGETVTFASTLYAGPKLQDEMKEVAPGLELTVDYGFLTVLAQPLFWMLKWIHAVVGNWGWAIVLLTLLIKLVFYKLSETSYKSMANMRKLAPRLKTLKERYGDDKQRLNQAMMEMYKTEKINPLGGCLPILVQIPVFIALYWVLLESVELRQADFIFWLTDLSTRDPYFVLPLIMGATMIIQQKLNPAPLDPIQAKVMMILPVVFTVFFAFFPSGLVLYWVVNNTLSIAQQWVITRRIEAGAKS
ncbi:MAG: membrane protein insertase YidC [Gammaproteobacteria bacterium]